YGIFVLATAIVLWVEWTLASFFSRATVRMVSDSSAPMDVAGTMVKWEFGVGIAAGIVLGLGAPSIAAILNEPAVAAPLRLLAIDIPIFSLGQALRNSQVGIGRFDHRAAASAARSVMRLVLTLLLLHFGFSITGALLAMIGASIAEALVASRGLRLGWRNGPAAPAFRLVAAYAVPTFLFAAAVRVFDRLDLLMLKATGATTASAGLYGATLTATRIPMLLAGSIAPLILATMTMLLRSRETEAARTMARQSVRVTLLFLPFAAIGAGSAPGLLRLALGREYIVGPFVPSALIAAAAGLFLLSVAVAILTAAGKPGVTSVVGGVMVLAAFPAHLFMIPRFGPEGASAVTAVISVIAAGITARIALRVVPTKFPVASLVRCTAIALPGYLLAVWLGSEGPIVLLTVTVLSLFALLALYLVREIGPAELKLVATLRPGTREAPIDPDSTVG
ncbi:MAG TPA: oligosaccharide flippase family protein, partial [Thermoanaerobaculia bacterium]|nr:oligosaccharide flippase family protein [Thermoanaerobaculia bacterium]